MSGMPDVTMFWVSLGLVALSLWRGWESLASLTHTQRVGSLTAVGVFIVATPGLRAWYGWHVLEPSWLLPWVWLIVGCFGTMVAYALEKLREAFPPDRYHWETEDETQRRYEQESTQLLSDIADKKAKEDE